jgi:beta-lactam-binding protein with PASTA domain
VSCWLLLGLDPQLDVVRLRLAAFGLVLRDITIKPCPTLDVPGASLEELPGTVIDQHPPGGEKVAASSAVDVTVCMPD